VTVTPGGALVGAGVDVVGFADGQVALVGTVVPFGHSCVGVVEGQPTLTGTENPLGQVM
jgi:hypothetical protein